MYWGNQQDPIHNYLDLCFDDPKDRLAGMVCYEYHLNADYDHWTSDKSVLQFNWRENELHIVNSPSTEYPFQHARITFCEDGRPSAYAGPPHEAVASPGFDFNSKMKEGPDLLSYDYSHAGKVLLRVPNFEHMWELDNQGRIFRFTLRSKDGSSKEILFLRTEKGYLENLDGSFGKTDYYLDQEGLLHMEGYGTQRLVWNKVSGS